MVTLILNISNTENTGKNSHVPTIQTQLSVCMSLFPPQCNYLLEVSVYHSLHFENFLCKICTFSLWLYNIILY